MLVPPDQSKRAGRKNERATFTGFDGVPGVGQHVTLAVEMIVVVRKKVLFAAPTDITPPQDLTALRRYPIGDARDRGLLQGQTLHR